MYAAVMYLNVEAEAPYSDSDCVFPDVEFNLPLHIYRTLYLRLLTLEKAVLF